MRGAQEWALRAEQNSHLRIIREEVVAHSPGLPRVYTSVAFLAAETRRALAPLS